MKLYNILGTRKIWFTVSGLLVTASIVGCIIYGFNLGIDFTGGSLLQVRYTADRPEVHTINEQLGQADIHNAVVQPSGDDTFIIKTQFLDNTQRTAAMSALGETAIEESFESIGPTIGQELRQKAVSAIILVLVAIIVYVSWAFRGVSRGPVPSWAYGASAIIALIHDLTITLGVFVVLGEFYGVEINAMFITALLTILGFSVHDTIVVFDRIREGLRRSKQDSFEGVLNESINLTMMRSLNTSTTALIMLIVLFFFGGESIRYFILALIIGITVGTYSSVFVASPLLLVWQKILKRR